MTATPATHVHEWHQRGPFRCDCGASLMPEDAIEPATSASAATAQAEGSEWHQHNGWHHHPPLSGEHVDHWHSQVGRIAHGLHVETGIPSPVCPECADQPAAGSAPPRLPLGTCIGDRAVVHQNSTEQLHCWYCGTPTPPEPKDIAWMTDAVVEQAMEVAGRAVLASGGPMIEHHAQFVRDFRAALLAALREGGEAREP